MVKTQKEDITKKAIGKGFEGREQRARKINASTDFEPCTEQISAFGGLLGLIKFLDLVRLEEIFERHYVKPHRGVKLGHYRMVVGILMHYL